MATWHQDAEEASRDSGNRRLSGRIHILGLGNVGTFVAHSLASRPSPPPITLLMHTPNIYRSWLERKKCLAINTNGLDDVKTGFDVNVLNDKTWYSVPYWNKDGTAENGNVSIDGYTEEVDNEELFAQPADEPIECLIVAVKAPVTVAAMDSVKRRLTPDSTVLFLQNGMGTIDELNEKVFRDPQRRPHYMSGVISHGLARRKEPFQVSHTGVGTTILGSVLPADAVSSANQGDVDWAPSTKYLLRTLTLTPPLVAVAETPSALMLYQLEKLAMNCVINPLTAIMNCKNGELLYNYSFTRIMRLLLIEISSVICALPELQGIPGIESRFSPERLRMMIVQLANKTAKNHSSMLQDILARNPTEIEYLNGYIVRRGEELGIKCVVNYMMQHLVLAKRLQTKQVESGAIPIDLLREPKI
ncbi:putative 2-dehydropantoate 2-reductase [Aspergillus nomiae NRRL 13137]|uniref:2-dehydropantoate 2-reductase n=1 Tax=Aspergillus nomiae NRRL (strain ATCC 15546 / NRRL 13137 / CBS 260.88 / M93) TaxID=1509407 RepID=A0A0L1J2F6_ASPN3|nr:putative 2-dehydropantoate 2-reductase [Aspergillus nomiae NRRL 13137]KNG85865.1 putative 2-dehydropantoate 2-reductase [Aspergillus nomiae NRRL 13137]